LNSQNDLSIDKQKQAVTTRLDVHSTKPQINNNNSSNNIAKNNPKSNKPVKESLSDSLSSSEESGNKYNNI